MTSRSQHWIVAALVIAALLSATMWAAPYDLVRRGADLLSEDGNAVPFDRPYHGALRSLGALLALFFAAAAVVATTGLRRRFRSLGLSGDDAGFLGVGAFLFCLCSWYLFYQPWPTSYDVWHHIAAVKALARPVWSHPFFDTVDPHLFASPYHLLLGIALRWLGGAISVFDLMVAAGLFNLLILLTGLYLFLGLFLPRRGRLLCLVLMLLLVGVAGIKGDFRWFSLHQLGSRLPYPSHFAIGASLWMLWATELVLRRHRPWLLLLLAPCAAAVLLSHPISSTLLFTGLATTAALCVYGREWRGASWLVLTLAGAGVLALAWPYYSLLALVTGGSGELHGSNWTMIYGPGWGALRRNWPQLLLGVPAAVVVARAAWRGRDPLRGWLAVTTAALGVCFALGAVPRLGVLGRTLGPLTFLLDLCLAIAIADTVERLAPSAPLRRRAPLIGAALLVVWAPYFLWANGPLVRKRWLRGVAGGVRLELRHSLGFVGDQVGAGEVVLADLETSFKIPAFTDGKVVAVPHPLAFAPDAAQRRAALNRFFSSSATAAERAAVVDQYRPSWLLLDQGSEVSPGELGAIESARSSRYRLFALPAPLDPGAELRDLPPPALSRPALP